MIVLSAGWDTRCQEALVCFSVSLPLAMIAKTKRNCIEIERSENIIENKPSEASSYHLVAE